MEFASRKRALELPSNTQAREPWWNIVNQATLELLGKVAIILVHCIGKVSVGTCSASSEPYEKTGDSNIVLKMSPAYA